MYGLTMAYTWIIYGLSYNKSTLNIVSKRTGLLNNSGWAL